MERGVCSWIISKGVLTKKGPALPHDNTRGKSSRQLDWDWKCRKFLILLPYQSWKPSALSKLCHLVLDTDPPQPCLAPHFTPVNTLATKVYCPRKLQPWQKPGNKHWRQMSVISDHIFPFRESLEQLITLPPAVSSAGPGPSSITLSWLHPLCFCDRATKVLVSIFPLSGPSWNYIYSPVSIHIIFIL